MCILVDLQKLTHLSFSDFQHKNVILMILKHEYKVETKQVFVFGRLDVEMICLVVFFDLLELSIHRLPLFM